MFIFNSQDDSYATLQPPGSVIARPIMPPDHLAVKPYTTYPGTARLFQLCVIDQCLYDLAVTPMMQNCYQISHVIMLPTNHPPHPTSHTHIHRATTDVAAATPVSRAAPPDPFVIRLPRAPSELLQSRDDGAVRRAAAGPVASTGSGRLGSEELQAWSRAPAGWRVPRRATAASRSRGSRPVLGRCPARRRPELAGARSHERGRQRRLPPAPRRVRSNGDGVVTRPAARIA